MALSYWRSFHDHWRPPRLRPRTLFSPPWDPRDICHRNAVPLHLRWSHLNVYKHPRKETAQLTAAKNNISCCFFGWALQQKKTWKKIMCPMKTVCFLFRMEPFVFCWFTAKLPMFFFWIHFYEILHNVAVNLWEFCFRFAFFLSGGSWWGRKMFRNFQPFWTILVHWDYIYIYCPNKGWIDKH